MKIASGEAEQERLAAVGHELHPDEADQLGQGCDVGLDFDRSLLRLLQQVGFADDGGVEVLSLQRHRRVGVVSGAASKSLV